MKIVNTIFALLFALILSNCSSSDSSNSTTGQGGNVTPLKKDHQFTVAKPPESVEREDTAIDQHLLDEQTVSINITTMLKPLVSHSQGGTVGTNYYLFKRGFEQ